MFVHALNSVADEPFIWYRTPSKVDTSLPLALRVVRELYVLTGGKNCDLPEEELIELYNDV
jgi:hypothetical protein